MNFWYFSIFVSSVISVSFCPVPDRFCIDSESSTTGRCWTIHSATEGWAAIGFGSRTMTGADIVIGWKNSTNGVTLSNRQASGRVMPALKSVQSATPVAVRSVPSFAKISYSFCQSNQPTASPLSYIYASGSKIPTGNIDTKEAKFAYHDSDYGTFDFDFISNSIQGSKKPTNFLQTSSSFSFEAVVLIHGIMMFIAWMVVPTIGIFIARFLKLTLGPKWFTLHMMLMGFATVGFTIAASTFMFLFNESSAGPYFVTSHAKIGLTVFLISFIQTGLGIVADKWFSPNRKSVPWWDKAHWWLGRALVVLGIVNVYLGIMLVNDRGYSSYMPFLVCFWLAVVGAILIFGYGQYRYGQVHEVHAPANTETSTVTIA
ncbi:hypothetical protein BC833DRAFT_618708 [Globomyces pollinis-pini]|nr:hypothetical protein BC833DRAFT_618708 [Globomyces pollinis-pini]